MRFSWLDNLFLTIRLIRKNLFTLEILKSGNNNNCYRVIKHCIMGVKMTKLVLK